MSETQSSGQRPPVVPPASLALGGAGNEDDAFLRAFRTHLNVLRASSLHSPSIPRDPEANAEAQGALDALDLLLRGAGTEFLLEAVAELYQQRVDLQDQLALERMVARPPRKGYELIHPEDDRPTAIEREIGLIDTILKVLERPSSESEER